MKTDIFNFVYSKHIPELIAKKYNFRFKHSEDIEDYAQSMYELLLNFEDWRIEPMYDRNPNELLNFFARICYNQLNKNGSFAREMDLDINILPLNEYENEKYE